MMYTTKSLLNNSTYPLARAIASRLGVRSRKQNRKDEWINSIHDYLLSPALFEALLPTLSPRALQALFRLAAVETLPTELFLNEYGPIRYPRQVQSGGIRAADRKSPTGHVPAGVAPSRALLPPWRQPESAAEELYYSGLLYSGDHRTLAKSRVVTLPIEIRERLLAIAPSSKELAVAASASSVGVAAPEPIPGLALLHCFRWYNEFCVNLSEILCRNALC